ncbi:hypothetical protein [Terrisporobacter glycolicus]|nr:hypothetical protein [Terrisporobacter glycolicus]
MDNFNRLDEILDNCDFTIVKQLKILGYRNNLGLVRDPPSIKN